MPYHGGFGYDSGALGLGSGMRGTLEREGLAKIFGPGKRPGVHQGRISLKLCAETVCYRGIHPKKGKSSIKPEMSTDTARRTSQNLGFLQRVA